MYDSRIGRFLSVDPLTASYPAWSPYPFAMNRPIDGVDLDGLEYLDAEKIWSSVALGKLTVLDVLNEDDYVEYNGATYLWVGRDIYSGLFIETEWINESLSTAEQTNIVNYYFNYSPTLREEQNECHGAGCCIDCFNGAINVCLLYTSPSPRDQRGSRMPSSA